MTILRIGVWEWCPCLHKEKQCGQPNQKSKYSNEKADSDNEDDENNHKIRGLGVNIYEKGMIVDVKKVSSHPVKTKKKDQRIMFMPVFN